MEPAHPPETLIKQRYVVKTVLGQGGFGRTYLVHDSQTFNQLYVLKEFAVNSQDPKFIEKSKELFEREASVLCQLDHAQIPKYHDYFEDQGRLFLGQEYICGKNYAQVLEDRRSQGRKFSGDEITQFLKSLLPVLQYVHDYNIIHRDIAPENIILPDNGTPPRLIDFGGAKKVLEDQAKEPHKNTFSSRPTIIGRDGYSARELATGGCFPSSDLYALAVTCIVLLTDKSPRELHNSYTLKWRWGAYTSVSDRLANILNKMLEEAPHNRYQSAADVLNALSATELSFPPESSPNSIPPQKERPPSLEVNPAKPSNLVRAIVLGVGLPVLIGIGMMAASPYIKPICQQLNNCIPDPKEQAFATSYDRAVKQANSALTLSKNPQSLEELISARNRLQNAVRELQSIPEDVEIRADVTTVLPNYEAQLNQLEESLDIEEDAQQKVSQAEEMARRATELTEQSQTVEELQGAKSEWEEAIQILEGIPGSSLTANKVQEYTEKYRSKLDSVNRKILELEARERDTQTERTPRSEEITQPASPSLPQEPSQPASPSPTPQPSGTLPSCDVLLFGLCQP